MALILGVAGVTPASGQKRLKSLQGIGISSVMPVSMRAYREKLSTRLLAEVNRDPLGRGWSNARVASAMTRARLVR